MKAHRSKQVRSTLGACLLLSFSAANSLAQQPPPQSPPANGSALPAQPQAATPPDVAAREDELIKLCNQQLNVKGQFKEAEETAKQALELSEKLDDKKRILIALIYLGSAYAYEGRQLEALEVFERTANLARETGNKKALSRALNNIAGVLGNLGRLEESLSYMYQCMDVARELGDQPMQYTVLTNIGRLYLALEDPDKAEPPLLESLRVGRELKHSDLVSNPSKVATETSLMLLGGMEAAREHFPVALKYFERVRESHPDNAQTQVELLNGIAVVHQRLGEYQKAAEIVQEAMPIAEKAHSADYPVLIANLGEAQESLGQLKEALATEDLALTAFRKTSGNPDEEWQIERRIGHIDRALGRQEEALERYKNSIRELEHLRSVTLNTEAGRASFGALSRAVYAETSDLLCDLHREAEAFEVAERGRARAFLDILATSRSGIPDELTPEQHQQEESKLARISATQKELWKENLPADQEKQLKARLAAAEDDLDAFHLEVRRGNPRYASIQYPEPINVAQIQSRLLDDRTALLEFLLGEERSLVWVVTKGGLTTSPLPPRREIETQVTEYRKLLTRNASALTLGQSTADIQHLGAKLYASLLKPIEGAVASSRSLIIIADGTLNYVPFEALVTAQARGSSVKSSPSFLVERFAILYGPSASALVTVQAMNRKTSAPAKTLLAFGDPVLTPALPSAVAPPAVSDGTRSTFEPSQPSATDDYTERGFSLAPLPYTRDEVHAISRLFPADQREVYLGNEAREETVKSARLDDFRYIHFASHGFLDEAKPGRSGIVLSRDPSSSEDGVLQMGEIMRLKMNADLVTLSACSTGLGKLVSGEGLLGLTRAFFYSGARNVTVSLWNVNDAATAELMRAYYENLKRGLPKSSALRQAKLSLLHGPNPTWRQPYFWAAFVLVGDGK